VVAGLLFFSRDSRIQTHYSAGRMRGSETRTSERLEQWGPVNEGHEGLAGSACSSFVAFFGASTGQMSNQNPSAVGSMIPFLASPRSVTGCKGEEKPEGPFAMLGVKGDQEVLWHRVSPGRSRMASGREWNHCYPRSSAIRTGRIKERLVAAGSRGRPAGSSRRSFTPCGRAVHGKRCRRSFSAAPVQSTRASCNGCTRESSTRCGAPVWPNGMKWKVSPGGGRVLTAPWSRHRS
jgi:hypothetical protein